MIVIVYGTGVYKEYLLPNIMNADYSLTLDGKVFGLSEDQELLLEITPEGWRLLGSDHYVIFSGAGMIPEKILEEGDILELTLEGEKRVQLIVTDAATGFQVMRKFFISGLGRVTVGKKPENDICYSFQNLISGYHASLQWYADGVYIEDSSTNGVFVKYRRITGRKKLEFGDIVNIFGLQLIYLGDILAVGTNYGELSVRRDTLECCAVEAEPQAQRTPQKLRARYFNRSPRNLPVISREPVDIEAPPSLGIKKEKPLLLTIGPAFTMAIPMLLGCGMAIFSSWSTGRNAGAFMFTGIITAVASAILGVFWGMMNIRYARQEAREDEEQRFNAYGNYLIRIADRLKQEYEQNERAMHTMYPAAESCCQYGEGSASLWNRNAAHPDFLFHRLGLGDQLFQVEISVPREKFSLVQDPLAEKPLLIQQEYKTLHKVPVGVDMAQKRLIGLVGGPERAGSIRLMHVLAAQIAACNCYTDVKMAFLYDRKTTQSPEDWECMKWFPHVWAEDRKTRYMGGDALERGDVCFELANILRSRAEQEDASGRRARVRPHYVIFVQDSDFLEGELIRKYLYDPRETLGITVFLMAATCEQLPNECEDIIQQDEYFSCIYNVMDNSEERKPVQFDTASPRDLERFGRRICRLQVNEVESTADIPSSLDFFSMYQASSLEDFHVLDRWRKNRTYNSMKALIGKKMGDADCFLDIHEKYHGPHGLIAGTTGSGKSETLQTYMLSLAINFSPDDIAFFVIDFKGGGMANLFSDLPHMAGQISNLSGNQVRRAMISIKSENTRRQKIFSDYGVNNINLYTRLYKNGEAALPVPHLFIIIDEFAELKREEPDFMRELISVAQVGRSLGVHLILATQKPSGTVDDNIWSNAKFRLCLRVQDRQDSNDMLHKPDAAFITQAGRCYLQVGNDEIYELFQSGFSGAVYDEELQGAGENAAILLTETGKAAVIGGRKRRKKKAAAAGSGVKEKTQLDAVVEYLKKTALENGYTRGMQLWLPVLPETLYLEELSGYEPLFDGSGWKQPEGVWKLSAMAGLSDDPVNQAQLPMEVDFAEGGHHAVCGTVASGKSTFLQTVLYALTGRYSPDWLNIYGIDFSSRMLAPFEDMPHTGGIVYEGQQEKAGRLFHLMGQFLKERKELLKGGTYAQYVKNAGNSLPAVLLVIDNYAGFKEKTANEYEDTLIQIAREGVSYGIFLLISSAGFGLAEIPSRIGDHIRTVISLEMGDKFKYMDVLRTTHIPVLPETNVKGRGLAFRGKSLLEFQTALALPAEDDFARSRKIRETAARMSEAWEGPQAKRIPEIPENPTLTLLEQSGDYEKENVYGEQLPFAYSLTDASLYSVRLEGTYCYSILGRSRTGKTNTMKLLLHAAAAQPAKTMVIENGSPQLNGLAREYGMGYAHTPREIFLFFKELLPVFAQRNKQKQALLARGFSDEEIFREMKKEQSIYIFIADLAEFMRMIYSPQEGVGDMHGFLENILEKGSLHNIYFFACLNTDDAPSLAGYRAYASFVGYKRGVHLGGNLSAQRIFSFRNIPYAEMSRTLKKGLGLTPDAEDDTIARRIVIPNARRQPV